MVVPVIRNVESMNYPDIEIAINKLGEKARNNAIAIEDMDGGTFTISNGGVFGSLLGTPIINPPQSSILGMHGIFDRPVARNGQVRGKIERREKGQKKNRKRKWNIFTNFYIFSRYRLSYDQ